jgi:ribosome-associated protein
MFKILAQMECGLFRVKFFMKQNTQKIVLEALENYKGIDIVSMDVRELTDIADTMIICTGTSKRHVQSMAEQVVLQAKTAGIEPLGIEGEQEGEWTLIDLGDVIVHIMLAATRQFYSLEKLWMTAEEYRKGQ